MQIWRALLYYKKYHRQFVVFINIFPLIFWLYSFIYIYALFPVIRPPYELISFLTVNMVYSVYETLICFFPCLLCYYTKCQLFPCFQPLIFIPKRVWKTYLGYFFFVYMFLFPVFHIPFKQSYFFSLKRFIRYMNSDHPCHRFFGRNVWAASSCLTWMIKIFSIYEWMMWVSFYLTYVWKLTSFTIRMSLILVNVEINRRPVQCKSFSSAALAQWVRALVPQVEGWVS